MILKDEDKSAVKLEQLTNNNIFDRITFFNDMLTFASPLWFKPYAKPYSDTTRRKSLLEQSKIGNPNPIIYFCKNIQGVPQKMSFSDFLAHTDVFWGFEPRPPG